LLQHPLGGGAGDLRSAQGNRIAVNNGLDPEPVLEDGEICVVIAEKIAHEPHVVEEHDGRLSAPIGLLRRRSLHRGFAPARQ
jgi:hypothetical protein